MNIQFIKEADVAFHNFYKVFILYEMTRYRHLLLFTVGVNITSTFIEDIALEVQQKHLCVTLQHKTIA